jgi:Tol biopolymer transport system component
MELVYCSECQGFSSPGSKVCQQCGKPIKDEPEVVAAVPSIAAKPIEEPPVAETPPEEAAPELPPFDAPPEVVAKADGLLAAIEKDPAVKTPYLQLSQLYAERKRRDLATSVLERYLEVDPNDANVKHRLAQLARPAVTAAAAAPTAAAAPVPRAAARPATMPPQKIYSPAGVAHRPPPPVIRREFQGLTQQRKMIIAGVLGGVALLAAVKVFVFPGTRLLAGGEFKAFAPSFSPTGKHLAFLVSDARSTQLAVHDLGRGAHRTLATVSGEGFSWSPDGSRLAYVASGGGDDWGGSVFVVDVNTGQSRKVAAGSSPVWSGGSTLIMVCSPEPPSAASEDDPNPYMQTDWRQRYCRVDVATGSVSRSRLAAEWGGAVSGSVDSVVYEQVKDSAAVATGESPEKEAERFVDRVVAGGARNFAEGSRDLNRELEAKKYEERRKAAGKSPRLPYEADVVVASLDGGSPTLVTSGGQSGFPSWTADGRILYATNGASGIEMWSMSASGGDKKAVLSGTKLADPSAVQVTRDGRYVFFVAPVEGDPGMAKAMTGEEPADIHVAPVGGSGGTRLSNKHPFKQRFAVSPDGSKIAYEVLQDVKVIGGAGRSEIWLLRR